MGDAPVFSKGRDLEAAAAALRPYLAARLDVDDVTIDGLTYPQGAGVSNETILLEARAGDRVEELVLRIAPRPEHQMFLDPNFRLQYDLLATFRRLGTVRVPEPLWFCEDTSLLGQEFYFMRRMRGSVPVSMPVYNKVGFLFDATPAQRRVAWESAMEQFCAIHRTPVEEIEFVGQPEHGDTGTEQQLSYWTTFANWSLAEDTPELLRTLLGWLSDNRPLESVPGLSWGDSRMGNMMFGADFRVVGVMDWEQASLGGPVADLGWWLHFDEMHSVYQDLPRLDGLGGRDETIQLWRELTGREPDHLLWHEVFACVKTGILGLHTKKQMKLPIAQDSGPSPFLVRACRLLDLNEIPVEA